MRILVAAMLAVLAALIETSVLSGAAIGGGRPDLVLTFTVVATMMIGVEDGLTWAFVGGLVLDIVLPGRRMGMTSLALLLMAGLAGVVGHVLPGHRLAVAALTVAVLGLAYQVLVALLLVAVVGAGAALDPASIVRAAILDGLLAAATAGLVRTGLRRFAPAERPAW